MFLMSVAAATCLSRDLVALAPEAREQLFDGHFEASVEAVRLAEGSLACPDAFLVPGQLSGLFQAGAAAALLSDQRVLAVRWYELSQQLGPHEGFDADLAGEEGRALFEEATDRIKAVGTGTVRARADLRVDGWALLRGQEQDLPVGAHVVQYLGEEATLQSELVIVGAGELTRVGPLERAPVALAGAGSLLVVGGAVALNLAYRQAFDVGGEQWVEADPDALARQAQQANARVVLGTVGVGVGAGLLVLAVVW